jgi:hypothetical protein
MKNRVTAYLRLSISLVSIFSSASFMSVSGAFSSGYILTGAYAGKTTVLIDKEGKIIHTWDHAHLLDSCNGYSSYLLKNGNLLRTAQVANAKKITGAMPWQGAINEVDPSGKVVWRYVLSNDTFTMHHDIKPLPGGNVLAISFMVEPRARLIAAGVDTNLLRSASGAKFILSEKIIEIKPTYPEGGEIVWQWVMFDHVVPKAQASAHPELISGGIVGMLYNQTQWVHMNGLDYCSETDLIVFSSRVFSECFVIDHGTTMAEAAGHAGGKRGKGGDILYRWGKPANYDASGATTIDCLHCPNWIPKGYPGEGNIIFFHNNGMGMQGSQVIEIAPPRDQSGKFQYASGKAYGPTQPTWMVAPGDSFSSGEMGSAFRLPNGNSLAHVAYPRNDIMNDSACSTVWEITPEKKVAWIYRLKQRSAMEEGLMGGMKESYNPAKIMYYPDDYEGVKNLLDPNRPHTTVTIPQKANAPQARFNPITGIIEASNLAGGEVAIISPLGRKVLSARPAANQCTLGTRGLSRGMYVLKTRAPAKRVTNEVIMAY